MLPNQARRIVILGNSGSGKSYLARELGKAAGLPVIHLDNEFWKPGWVKTPKEEWIARQQELIAAQRWIMDGNYNATMELRFAAADLVIFMDINRFVCFFSALVRHGKKRSDLPEYLEERYSWDFMQFLWWILADFPGRGKKKIMALHQKYPDTPFIRIRSRRALRRMLCYNKVAG